MADNKMTQIEQARKGKATKALRQVAEAEGLCEQQAQEGVDFMTVHAGLTSKAIDRLKKQGRAADIVKGVKGAAEKDFAISEARRKLDWDAQKKLAIDPYKFEEVRSQRKTKTKACSMCGDFCALQMVEDFLNSSEKASDGSS